MDKNLVKMFKLLNIQSVDKLSKFNNAKVVKAFPSIEQNVQTIIIECHDYVYELANLCKVAASKYLEKQQTRYAFKFIFVRDEKQNISELLRKVISQTYKYVYKVALRPKSSTFEYDKNFNVLKIKCVRPHQHDNLFKLTNILNLIINSWYKIGVVIKIYNKEQPQIFLSCSIDTPIHKTKISISAKRDQVNSNKKHEQISDYCEKTTQRNKEIVEIPPIKIENYDSIKSFYDNNSGNDFDFFTIIAQVISLDERNIQTKVARKHLYILNLIVTDNYIDSLRCNIFAADSNMISAVQKIKKNDWVKLKGKKRFNKFYEQFILNFYSFEILEPSNPIIYHDLLQINDNAKQKRIELHCHTKMSAFDGINFAEECLLYATYGFQHQALGITDINNCQSFIKAYDTAVMLKQAGKQIKLIYGVDFSLLSSEKLVVLANKNDQNFQSVLSIDLETTGIYAKFNEIIEIGAYKVHEDLLNDNTIFQEYIKVAGKIPQHITELTRITNEKLSECGKPVQDVIRNFAKLIEGEILIAHNASFDNSFLQKYFAKYNFKPNYSIIDTLDLARILYPGKKSYRLEKLAKFKNVQYDLNQAHGAVYDARVLGQIWLKMQKDLHKQYPKVQTLNQLEKLVKKKTKSDKTYHNILSYHQPSNILCIAKTQKGIFDLYQAVTNSATIFFHGREMIPISELLNNRRNFLLISPGINSQLTSDILMGIQQNEIVEHLIKYDAVEINPPTCYIHLVEEQKLTLPQVHEIIKLKIKYAKIANKPVYASGNVFYLHKNQKKARDVMINAKQIKGKHHLLYSYKNNKRQNPDHHYRNTVELTAEFSFLADSKMINELVVTNTNTLANKIADDLFPVTKGLHKPTRKNCHKMLEKNTYQEAKKIFGDKLPKDVENRIKTELITIINVGYDIIYWTCHKLTEQSAKDLSIVGSRGSVGSSVVAFLNNITNVNPLFPYYLCQKCYDYQPAKIGYLDCGYDLPTKKCPKCKIRYSSDGFNIPFETFLGIRGEKIPDIDLNFDPDYQNIAHEYLYDFFGRKNCFRAGTIGTIKYNLAYGYVKNYEEETQSEFTLEQISLLTALCEGIKRTCGQHPGGIIVVPKTTNVHKFTPVNRPANDQTCSFLTTHYPFDSLHHNLLKFDILGHDDPKVIKRLIDLTGKKLTEIEFVDENIIKMFQTSTILNTHNNELLPKVSTLGIPEFGTKFVIDLLTEIQPKNISDLVRISGLSHGTNVWKNNFQAIMPKYKLDFDKIICCRDDIMIFLENYGITDSDAFAIMEDVRKGLKIKQSLLNIMSTHNVPTWFVEACLKISYIFPKAHASAYVISAWKIAWFKYYMPLAFYSAIFSIKCSVYDYEIMQWSALRLQKYIKGCEANTRKVVPAKEKNLLTTLRLVVEFKQRGYDFLPINVHLSDSKNFIIHEEDKKLLMPFCVISGLGSETSQKIVNERTKKQFVDYNDLKQRARINKNYRKYFENNF